MTGIQRLAGPLLLACAACRGPSAPPAAASPGPGVELFGAGLFTTGAWDFFVAFAPDQRQALLGRADPTFTDFEIFETRRGADDVWSTPVRPAFASRWSDADPHISPSGDAVFFISNRPFADEGAARPTHDIWTAARAPDGAWGPARRLPEPVNDPERDEYSPAVAADGDLYFGSERPDGAGGSDLYVARRAGDGYLPPENLGPAINTPGHEVEPWIAPDASYMIFAGLRRADSVGQYDLYVSRRRDGQWTPARVIAEIATPATEWNHSVSPDGEWLYFTSNRVYAGPLGPRLDAPRDDRRVAGIGDGKQGDMYRVPMRALDLR